MVASVSNIVEVDPTRGNDAPSARPQQPYKTITAALADSRGNTLIKLAPGFYSKASGETFPLVLADGIILNGPGGANPPSAVISGGGKADSLDGFVALVLAGNAQLRGLSIRNSLGSGVAVTGGTPLIRTCHISRCPQYGVVISGQARPQIIKTQLEDHGGSAIRFVDQAKGVIEDCTLQRCQVGIAIEDQAAPLIMNVQCLTHETGVMAKGNSSPVLRGSRFIQNRAQGLWLQGNSRPDLGQPADPANNMIRYNGQADIRNDTGRALLAVGNDLLPQRMQGPVTLAATSIPDPNAVPQALLGQTEPAPSAEPGTASPPAPTEAPPMPAAANSRFSDVRHHWAAAYIEALANRGLVKGYDNGLYRPDETINRAQFAAMVTATFRAQPAVKGASRFVDVPAQHWASNAITQAQRQGFISGYPDQTFRPDQPMTRVQAIVAVAQGLKLAPASANLLSVYRDRVQIPSYAIDATAAATRHKLVVNHPDASQLRPLAAMTRGEVAALIYQGLVAKGVAPPLAQQPVVEVQMTQGSFPDIQRHWAQAFIQGLLDRDLIRGYDDGRFYPERPMTRAQFAALVYGAFRPQPQRPSKPFRDVPNHHWASQAIQATYQGGFLSGFPDGSFAPDHPILRVQSWVALVNGLNLLPGQSANRDLLTWYVDHKAIPGYAADAVATATQLKLVVNAPNIQQLNPNRVATRAEIAAIVYQTLVHLQRAPRLNNAFIVYP